MCEVLCMWCDVLASEIIQVEKTAELGYMMYAEGIVSFSKRY
jgi:hypothetical protein